MLRFILGSIQQQRQPRFEPESRVRIVAGWQGGYFGVVVCPINREDFFLIKLDKGGTAKVHKDEMELV